MKLPEKPMSVKEIIKSDSGLSKAIQSEEFRKLVSEYNKRYLYWSELKYRISDPVKRKYAWALMKIMRLDGDEKISINGIDMKYNLLPDFNKKLHLFDKHLAGSIRIGGKSLNLQESYIINSLMEEAIASSQLEGAATTRKVAKAMLREKRKPKTESEKMIVNNYETMKLIINKKAEKMTPDLLSEIQRTITKGTLEDQTYEGKFRDNDDIAVRNDDVIAHQPPDYKEIEKLVKEFCDFANDNSDNFIHPIIKGIILHFLVGYIHPFVDGNGRTARSVFYWYLLSQGYWLFEYMAVSRRIVRSRTDYDLAYIYTEYDEMDLTYFIKYNLNAIEDSFNDLMDYIKSQQEEQVKIKKLITQNPDFNLRQALILEEFMKHPTKAFTIKEIMETYAIVYQTARTDLLVLEKKGLIDKKISGRAFVYLYRD